MKRKNYKKSKNFLDYIPVKNEAVAWEEMGTSEIVLHRPNRSVACRIGTFLWKKPSVSHITLERFGSFLWRGMDGKKTVYDLAMELYGEFCEEAEPLYERLVPYINSLYESGCIHFRKF